MRASPRRVARSLALRTRDAADRLTGRRDRLTPPRRMDFVGDSDFRATGEEFLGHFVELGGLKPSDRVLDIGSGAGRMARPLAGFLRPPGSYDGFDPSQEGVEWCRRHYVDLPVPFRFVHLDVRNAQYNPAGTVEPLTLRFPYDDGAFDFVFATSVFTHMPQEEVDRYLVETHRVLAPGGRFLATFFFEHGIPLVAPPESGIVTGAGWLIGRMIQLGFETHRMERGTWTGNERGPTLQDILVASRP